MLETTRRWSTLLLPVVLLAALEAPRLRSSEASQPAPGAPFLWLESDRPTSVARQALAVLRAAADEGLNPEDYNIGALDRFVAALDAPTAAAWTDAARFDADLTASMVRYLHDLHMGRIDPRAIGFLLDVPDDGHDFEALLREAVRAQAIERLVDEFRPPLKQYDDLKRALRAYRGLPRIPVNLPAPARSVHPGEAYDAVDRLREALIALGDRSLGSVDTGAGGAVGALYQGAVVDSVKSFQRRFGLDPDGVLGKATIAALNVPVTWRIRQIELALERLRWLPHLPGPRLLALNIPMFQLWGWDALPGNWTPSIEMAVIVGRALSTGTPVIAKELTEVIFRPYWNVPRSILLNEILPAVRRDPQYLSRQALEIVDGPGDDARVVASSAENLALLRQGRLRLRQRPGPRNSLGLVKFMFPNEENVYMHDTPAQSLFNRHRRDFSHGCVRVQNPIGLAEWVLADTGGWPRERIVAAMAGQDSQHVALRRPIQVLLFYTTAAVMTDGEIRFADDLYQHDGRLDRALTARRPRP